MTDRPFLFALLALTVAAGVVLTAAPASAAPPPVQLCAICDGGLDGATGEGTLDVYVDADGDSTWVERVPVDESAAEQYAEDHDHLDDAVSQAWASSLPHVADGDVAGVSSETEDGHVVVDASDVSSQVEDGHVVVTYAVADVASPGLGDVWVIDYFYAGDEGPGMRYWIGGERVTLHPPDGHAVTNDPPDAEHSNGSVTWYGEDPGSLGSDFDRETLVTYGPESGFVTTAATLATVATVVGPLILVHAAFGGFVPAFVLVAGALVAARIGPDSRVLGRVHGRLLELGRRRFGRAIAVLGLAGTVLGLAGTVLGLAEAVPGLVLATEILGGGVPLAAGAAGYALIGLIVSRLGGRLDSTPDPRWLLGGVLAITAGCATVTWAVFSTTAALAPVALVLSAVAFFPLGYLAERGECVTGPLLAIVVGPFLAVAAVAPVSPFGLGPFAFGFFVIPQALFVLAAGYPLSVLGRLLAADVTSTDSPPSETHTAGQPTR